MKYTTTVLIADGNPDSTGHALDSELVTWPENGVPVKMGIEEGAQVVGHAVLTLDGFRIVADIELNEEDMDMEPEKVGNLVPAVSGMGDPDDFNLEVQSLALGDWENADARITSLVPPPLHEVDDLGTCEVCGGMVTEGAPWCPGPPMTVAEVGQALVEATKPLMEAPQVLSVTIDAVGIIDPTEGKKVIAPKPPHATAPITAEALHQEAVDIFGDTAAEIVTTDEDGNEIKTTIGEE